MQSKEEVWKRIVEALNERNEGSGNAELDEAFLVYHYYSDVEKGGHEKFFTHFSEYIDLIGIEKFSEELTTALRKAGADVYANVFNENGQNAFFMFLGLEDGDAEDVETGNAIEKVDKAYNHLGGELKGKLESYFNEIYPSIVTE